MKKIIYILLLGTLVANFNACKKEDPQNPNHGSVSLSPDKITMKFGDEREIVPLYSTEGTAKDKVYDWKSSNDKIISFTRIAGGKISVKAKRIGDAVITYYAQDGSIFAESDISVNARTTFLGGIRFNPGESKNTVKNRVQWQLNEEESTENLLVYNVTGSEKIKQEIYYFESDKLFSLLVILNNTDDVKSEAQTFIEERFGSPIGDTQYITYYSTNGNSDYTEGSVVGIFLSSNTLSKENVREKLGVRYTTQSNLSK